jgi:hypothetical protein
MEYVVSVFTSLRVDSDSRPAAGRDLGDAVLDPAAAIDKQPPRRRLAQRADGRAAARRAPVPVPAPTLGSGGYCVATLSNAL